MKGPSGRKPDSPVRTFLTRSLWELLLTWGKMSRTAQTLGIIPAGDLGEEGTESAMGGPKVGFENLVFNHSCPGTLLDKWTIS